jgi:hypothetical protein
MSRNVAEPKWGRMASCGRLAIGLLELLLHRKAGRLTIGRRMPSCPTLAHADSPSIGECPSDLRRSEALSMLTHALSESAGASWQPTCRCQSALIQLETVPVRT